MIDGLEHFGWDDLIYLLLIPVAVVIILMVHELGHYLMARLYGIKIKAEEFGAGPALWSRTDKHGTRWTLYLYPAFAHVHLAGFEEADDDRRSFQSAGPLQKITTILAGPAANLILPFFLLFAFYMAFGQPAQKPVVTGIEIGQAGERAGLQYGDEVTAINGRPVSRFKDIDRMTYDRPDQDLVQIFTIRRDGRTMEITVKPDWVEYKDADGIPRAHNRLGVIWHSQPFDFDALRTIGGQDVKDQPKRIRRLVTENLDREMTLGFYATDGNVRNYKTIP